MDNTMTETTANSTNGDNPVLRRARVYAGIAVLVALIVATAIIGSQLSHGASVRAAAPTPTVSVSQPIQRQLHGRMQFLGQFSPVNQVELRAQVGGNLTYIGFKDGDVVTKGSLLFIIDPTPYQIKFDEGTAQVAKARARLELATTELTRAQTLQKTDAGTVENVDQRSSEQHSAQASLDEAEALVRDAKFDLDRSSGLCPFHGPHGNAPRLRWKSGVGKPRRR